MRFATYGRKSVYSDKSDSVGNQERMCREYADLKFAGRIDSFEVYQDEGFTGANTDRPGLERLIADVKDGFVDALIVYQLDRISRDVRDFSNIYALLEEKHVMFISIKENIDTATPIGKAMMYVTMVFAQMERETIAARVTDNMIGLAKKGYWTGGNPPYGYVRERILVDGKKHVTIVPDPEAARYVESIFDTFLENGYSLQGMETAFKRQGIRTPNGAFFSTTQLHKILTMPFCAPATKAVRDFYTDQGCRVEGPEEEWNGEHGVMIYGRSTQKNKKHQLQPRSEWVVCPGAHKPFLSEEKWLSAQEQFRKNTFEKTQKYDIPLLKGTLRCAKCGGLMQVSRKKKKVGVTSHYYCLKRMRQGPAACDMSAIKCDLLDQEVVAIFRRIKADPSIVRKYAAAQAPEEPGADIPALTKKIAAQSAKIERLAASLAEAENSSAQKYIVAEIERQDLNLAALKRELELTKAEKRKADLKGKSLESKAQEIGNLVRAFDSLSAADRNGIVREVVQECTWDGETLFLKL